MREERSKIPNGAVCSEASCRVRRNFGEKFASEAEKKRSLTELLTICMGNNNLLGSAKYEVFAGARFFI